MLRTFWTGGTLVLTNPTQAVATIERHRVNSMVIAPISLQKIVAARPDGAGRLPSLKVIEVGGSVLPTRLYELTRQRLGDDIVSYYGAMETGGVASAPISALPGDGRAVGYVHAGVEVQAVDAEHRPLPPGAEGTLRIRSDNVIPGYLDDSGATAQAFRDGWFYSGDVGAVSPDGIMTVTGRGSEFINAGGNKVSPHVIEEVLLSLPHVTDAAAFGVPDGMGVEQIWAAIVASERIETTTLKALCHARLAEKSPKFILQMKGLPRNANGKVMREQLIKFAMTQQR
jgi:acyl-coenzyme A synthetase/AMP-(fatty) acid ligase